MTNTPDKHTGASPDAVSHASAYGREDSWTHPSDGVSHASDAVRDDADKRTNATADRLQKLLDEGNFPKTADPGTSLEAARRRGELD